MTDKEAQLKAKLLKMKLAVVKKKKLSWKDKVRINNPVNPPNVAPSSVKKEGEIGEGGGLSDLQEHKLRRGIGARRPESETLDKMEGKFITEENAKKYAISTAKAKIKKLKKTPIKTMEKRGLPENILEDAAAEAGVDENQSPSYIAQDHGHRISFRSHSAGNFRTASLNEQSGKYAKYWLLNAKDTNGNGWGIASHTAKENMKKFIGRPLVVTASSWHGASEYGDEYEHPYLPTNDITAILDHQEKFRVGSIVDVVEDSHGDWFASVEMLPKFASSRLPPFCSPAIYQLDASEAEGQISKWEALHLAALTENPAYGARIALLKGTCVGTGSECKVQFKVAKQEATTVCPKKKQKISRLKSKLAVTESKKIPTSKVEGFAPLPNKRGDVSEFAKSLRTKKRDMYEELGHEKGKTVPYNIVKKPNRYTHKEEFEKGEKQFIDHIHAKNNRPKEIKSYMKKHGIYDEFQENRKNLSPKDRREKGGIGTGLDHPNIAGYTADNAVRWSKLKSRLAAVDQLDLSGNVAPERKKGRQKTVGTPEEVRQAFVEGRSLRSGNRMEDGVRTEDAHQTDGDDLFLFGNKILSKDGKGGYITNAKEWMGKGYKNATLKEYRALGIPVDTKGVIDPKRKYYSPDGTLLKTKGLEGDLNKEDITISKEQLFEGEVRLGDSTKAKPKVVDPNARRPLDNRHNLREFASASRKRLTGDASATRTPPYSETATQPEDAMLSNELLGFPKEHGLEKTFGKKTKTDSVFNLGIKGEYNKVPGPDTHHIKYKKTFRRPTGISPIADLKHYKNIKASPPGDKHQPFFNRGNNAIQLNTDEHTGGEKYAPQGLPSTRKYDKKTGEEIGHSLHSLNPPSNFKSILHSKLKSRLAAVGLPDSFGKDPKKFKDFKDFLDNFNQDAGPPEHERKSPFPLPKYFEKDYEAFHNNVQDSAFRFEDAQEAGIDLEDENFSINGEDVSQSWNDVSKEHQDKLRPHYQKHLSNELSWQKDPSIYTSGKLPKENQTYTKPGFHKNLTPMFENEPDGYKEINPKDIVSKTYDSTYDEPSKYSKLKSRLAGLGDENMTYQNSKKVKLHKTKNMGKNDKD
jgi:hypothetical protein